VMRLAGSGSVGESTMLTEWSCRLLELRDGAEVGRAGQIHLRVSWMTMRMPLFSTAHRIKQGSQHQTAPTTSRRRRQPCRQPCRSIGSVNGCLRFRSAAISAPSCGTFPNPKSYSFLPAIFSNGCSLPLPFVTSTIILIG
jgi:hypothetical protein